MVSHQDKKRRNRRIGLMVGVAAATGVTAVVAAPLVLAGVGFTAAGVAAGSLAALVQSSIGSVVAGSIFATLQSAGAVGIAATSSAGIAGAGASIGGIMTAVFTRRRGGNRPVAANETQADDTNIQEGAGKIKKEPSSVAQKVAERIPEAAEINRQAVWILSNGSGALAKRKLLDEDSDTVDADYHSALDNISDDSANEDDTEEQCRSRFLASAPKGKCSLQNYTSWMCSKRLIPSQQAIIVLILVIITSFFAGSAFILFTRILDVQQKLSDLQSGSKM